MRAGGIVSMTLWVVAVALCAPPATSHAIDLYFNNVDADLPGINIRPANWFEFHGDAGVVFTEEVTETGGVGGTQSYKQSLDTTGAASSFYFYSGFGHFAVDFTNMPTGPGSNDPSRYRFSADLKVEGNNGSAGLTPIDFRVAAIDPDYEEEHNIDVNGDTVISGGAAVYVPVVAPTVSVSGEYLNISFTLNQGTQDVDADVLPAHRVFSNQLSLIWQANFHAGGFGFDAGNTVSIDNIRIEFLEPVEVDGDYNGNGFVDAADYVVWRNNNGLLDGATVEQGDGTGDGRVDQDDYDYWAARYGNTSGSGAILNSASTAIPEPAGIVLLAIALQFGVSCRRRHG